MTNAILAADTTITPGEHWTVMIGGLNFNLDTIITTVLAGVVVCGLGIAMARGASATKPGKLQLIWESLVSWVQGQVRDGMGLRTPRGVVELGVTLFAFILICNLFSVIHFQPTEHVLLPPTADVNLVYALALFVIVWVNVAGIRANGARAHFGHLTKPYVALTPIEFVTQYFSRPISLALRLFGNIFAGGIMLAVISLLPTYIIWAPNAIWKLFDIFIGVIQALIFTLLTIIYFSEAVGEEHEAPAHATAPAAPQPTS